MTITPNKLKTTLDYRDPTGLEYFLPGAPWPILHKAELKTNVPEYRRICARDYVLWKDASGQVHALPDKCPHWGASLSQGKVQEIRLEHIRSSSPSPATLRSVVTCPWHAIAFDEKGFRKDEELDRFVPCAQFKPLELIETHGIIWTYAGFEPKIEIPEEALDEIAKHRFYLTCASTDVEASVEDLLLINHDYNHQNGTHGESFKITGVENFSFAYNPNDANHTIARFETPTAALSLGDILESPMRLLTRERIKARIDNYFPGIAVFQPQHIPGNTVYQVHLHYPIDKNRSHTSLAFFARFGNPLFKLFAPKLLREGGETVVKEDAGMFNQRHYKDKPKQFRLSHEAGAEYIWKRFSEWPN